MQVLTELPLSLAEVTPGPEFTKLSIPTHEGIHTGGPYLSPDGLEVWKPLDCRPYMNAPVRIPTHEAEALEALAGKPCFPRNWRVETSNGRNWLIRKVAYLIPEDYPFGMLSMDRITYLENALKEINAIGWGICDELKVALDPDTREIFILDLSNAHYRDPNGPRNIRADDSDYLNRWLRLAGYGSLVDLRNAGEIFMSWAFIKLTHLSFLHHHWRLYASLRRPIDSTWARIPLAMYFDGTDRIGSKIPVKLSQDTVYSWVLVPEPMDDALAESYELTLAATHTVKGFI